MNNFIALEKVSKIYRTSKTLTFPRWNKNEAKSDSLQDFTAIDNISLSISAGSTVGIIGANGAGKSTLLKMLCGIQRPTTGTISVLMRDPALKQRELLKEIGVVFGHKCSLWWDLPVCISFDTYKDIYEVPTGTYEKNKSELVEALNLSGILHKPVRNLSLGERVKCEIALALMHSPKVVLLDEPTLGLDIPSKQLIREYINYKTTTCATTNIITSHDINDIDKCCDRVIILHKGKIKLDGTLEHLIRDYSFSKILITSGQAVLDDSTEKEVISTLSKIQGYNYQRVNSSTLIASVPESMLEIATTLLTIHTGLTLHVKQSSLEDCMLSIINNFNGNG